MTETETPIHSSQSGSKRGEGKEAATRYVLRVAKHLGHFHFRLSSSKVAVRAGHFATLLRIYRQRGTLAPPLVALLDAEDFPWSAYDELWHRQFGLVYQCILTDKKVPSRQIKWWLRQRILAAEGQLPPARAARLASIPYSSLSEYHWRRQYRMVRTAVIGGSVLGLDDTRWLFRQVSAINREGVAVHWNRFIEAEDALVEDVVALLARAEAKGLLSPAYETPKQQKARNNAKRDRRTVTVLPGRPPLGRRRRALGPASS